MRRLFWLFVFFVCALSVAEAQYFPPTVAAGVVIGRMPGVGSGPVEQIPFANLGAALNVVPPALYVPLASAYGAL